MKKFYLLSLILISLNLPAVAPTGNGSSNKISTPDLLETAIIETNLPEINELIQEECELFSNDPFAHFRYYFNLALANENVEVVRLFLENGLNPNETFSKYDYRRSPQSLLERAITKGTMNHVKLLLEYGADPFQIRMTGIGLNKQRKENFEFVRTEQKKRGTTLLLCLKEKHPDMPIEMREKILGKVAHADNVKELFQDPAEEMELP